IDKMSRQLHEAEAALKQQQGSVSAETLAEKNAEIEALKARGEAQIELIQSLESELKTAKASKRSQGQSDETLESLQAELVKKNEIIQRLEQDADEQQRKLAKLRGSESETMRLKGLTAQNEAQIRALEEEIASLKSRLANQRPSAEGESAQPEQALRAALKERDEAIARLTHALKEQEGRTAELEDSVRTWKR